jgi:hypothetical protein
MTSLPSVLGNPGVPPASHGSRILFRFRPDHYLMAHRLQREFGPPVLAITTGVMPQVNRRSPARRRRVFRTRLLLKFDFPSPWGPTLHQIKTCSPVPPRHDPAAGMAPGPPGGQHPGPS